MDAINVTRTTIFISIAALLIGSAATGAVAAPAPIPEDPPSVTGVGNGRPREGNLYHYCWTTYSLPFILEECSSGSLIAIKSVPLVALDAVSFRFDYAVRPASVTLRYWDDWRRLPNTDYIQLRGRAERSTIEPELSVDGPEPQWSASWTLDDCTNCYVLLRVEWPDLQDPTYREWASYWFRVERSYATPSAP